MPKEKSKMSIINHYNVSKSALVAKQPCKDRLMNSMLKSPERKELLKKFDAKLIPRQVREALNKNKSVVSKSTVSPPKKDSPLNALLSSMSDGEIGTLLKSINPKLLPKGLRDRLQEENSNNASPCGKKTVSSSVKNGAIKLKRPSHAPPTPANCNGSSSKKAKYISTKEDKIERLKKILIKRSSSCNKLPNVNEHEATLSYHKHGLEKIAKYHRSEAESSKNESSGSSKFKMQKDLGVSTLISPVTDKQKHKKLPGEIWLEKIHHSITKAKHLLGNQTEKLDHQTEMREKNQDHLKKSRTAVSLPSYGQQHNSRDIAQWVEKPAAQKSTVLHTDKQVNVPTARNSLDEKSSKQCKPQHYIDAKLRRETSVPSSNHQKPHSSDSGPPKVKVKRQLLQDTDELIASIRAEHSSLPDVVASNMNGLINHSSIVNETFGASQQDVQNADYSTSSPLNFQSTAAPSNNFDGFMQERQMDIVCTRPEFLYENDVPDDRPLDVEMMDVSCGLQQFDQLTEAQSSSKGIKSCSDPRSFCIVADTNVLMQELKLIDELRDIPIQGNGSLHIIIPWLVLQELDCLKGKGKGESRKLAMAAVKYLNNMLTSKHPRFHGQSAKMSAAAKKEYDVCNDDVILACCLQLAEKIPRERIILLSNDVNLCNKAMVSNLSAHTTLTLKAVLSKEMQLAQTAVFVPQKCHEAAICMKGDENQNGIDSNKVEKADYIMREAKLLMKFCLEPFLREAMTEAFGDLSLRFVPPSPAPLCDILSCYQRYWISVFGLKFKSDVKVPIDDLSERFKVAAASYSTDVHLMLKTLKDAEKVCKAVFEFRPSIKPVLGGFSKLIKQCRNLVVDQQEVQPESRTKTEAQIHEENNEIVLSVLNHIWRIISHLCGLILSFAGVPHGFEFDVPESMPGKTEFYELICNLYPSIHKVRSTMKKLQMKKLSEEQREKELKALYNYLLHFVPSLKIQILPPPTDNFTVWRLKKFFNDPQNSEMLQKGLEQLDLFVNKLNECIRHPIWSS